MLFRLESFTIYVCENKYIGASFSLSKVQNLLKSNQIPAYLAVWQLCICPVCPQYSLYR